MGIPGRHPGDFAGLSFERGPLGPGGSGVAGNLFTPASGSLLTLVRNLGLGSLRIGGGTVDQLIPAGTGSDGFTGIDNLFAFAAAAGVKVIFSLRLLSPAAQPVADLKLLHAQAAGHIWSRYQHTWPASPSAMSRTGMPTTPIPNTRWTRRSTRRRRVCPAARTRPTWPSGGASRTRSWARPRERRCPARISGPIPTRPTVPARAAVWPGPSSLPATSTPPGGLPKSPSITTWGMNPGRPPPSRRSATCCPPSG